MSVPLPCVRAGAYVAGTIVLNGAVVAFPTGTFVYTLPPAVYLGFLVDPTEPLHLRAVGVIEAAVAAVMASSTLRNGSGPLLALRVALYDASGSNASALIGAMSRFAALPFGLGIIGGLFSGARWWDPISL